MSDSKFLLLNSTTYQLDVDMNYTDENCITFDLESASIIIEIHSKCKLSKNIISNKKD